MIGLAIRDARTDGSRHASAATRRRRPRRRVDQRIERAYVEEQRPDQARRSGRRDQAQHQTERHQLQATLHDHADDLRGLRAERHADADLRGALRYRVGEHGIEPDHRHHERQPREHRRQRCDDALRAEAGRDVGRERREERNRLIRIHRGDGRANHRLQCRRIAGGARDHVIPGRRNCRIG